MINQKILNYRITKLIGEGGMASVYEAVHEKFENKRVAVKVLNPILSANKTIRQRFLNEAKIMAELEHPNIVTVLDYDEQTEYLAIIMELLKGQTLSQYIKQNGAFKPDHAIALFGSVLDGFAFAHAKNVVHRDVKPANIFITEKGTVKILDFGIAKLFDNQDDMTVTGVQMGTLTYMSPEQILDSKHIDLRSDIYSLGVTLYYMLSGKPAYNTTETSDYHVRKAIVEEPFPKLLQNTQFQAIIDKATAKKPQDRFQTCAEFKTALLNFAGFENPQGFIDDDKTLIETNPTSLNEPDDKTLIDKPIAVTPLHKEQKKEDAKKTTDTPKPKSKLPLYIGLGVVAVLAIIFLIIKFTSKSAGEIEWIDEKNGYFIDQRDQHKYKVVKIGTQIWMAENLAYKANSGCWAYDNSQSNVAKYGYLYDWETSKKVAPTGWHLPSDDEWKQLEIELGLSFIESESSEMWRGSGVGTKLKCISGWNKNVNGSNESGFNAIPAGYLTVDGTFNEISNGAYFWSSSLRGQDVWRRYLYYSYSEIHRFCYHPANGYSVRCLRD